MTTRRSRPRSATLLPIAGVALIVLAAALFALRDSGGAVAGTGGPRIRVTGAYLPEPASPDTAAAYLTIHNDGDGPDVLLGVGSDVSDQVSLHENVEHGMTGVMRPMAAPRIPAGGVRAFAPGADHIMLDHPRPLTVGQVVTLTLRFQRSGEVRVRAPVIAIGAVPPTGVATVSSGGASHAGG